MFGSFNPKSEAKTQPEKTNGKHSKTQSGLKRLPDNQGSKAAQDQKSNKLKRLSEANEKQEPSTQVNKRIKKRAKDLAKDEDDEDDKPISAAQNQQVEDEE